MSFIKYIMDENHYKEVKESMSFIKYIMDENHYKEVLSLVGKAKQTVWIGKFCKDCGRRDYCSDPIK